MALSPGFRRYGIRHKDWGYAWATADERFDIAKHPNEPNRAGYVVEIDPLDPKSTPKKRTALGRMKHENAEPAVAANGRIVVYMGDDERGEYLYRYVSDGVYAACGDPEMRKAAVGPPFLCDTVRRRIRNIPAACCAGCPSSRRCRLRSK